MESRFLEGYYSEVSICESGLISGFLVFLDLMTLKKKERKTAVEMQLILAFSLHWLCLPAAGYIPFSPLPVRLSLLSPLPFNEFLSFESPHHLGRRSSLTCSMSACGRGSREEGADVLNARSWGTGSHWEDRWEESGRPWGESWKVWGPKNWRDLRVWGLLCVWMHQRLYWSVSFWC